MKVVAIALAVFLAFAPRAEFDTGIVHVERSGNPGARPIIFIPGLACGPWVWDAQITALAPRYNLFVVSLPGFDGRPMVTGGDLMRRAVNSIHTLIVSRHLHRPIIVGHSLGGTLAVLFAETYPHDAADIVTVEGGYPVAATQALRNAQVARSIAPYKGLTQNQLAGALRTNMLQYTITRRADVDRATRLAGRSEPVAIVAWMKAAFSFDLTPKLSVIGVPFTAIIPFDARIDPYQGFKTAADKLAAYRAWVGRARDGKVVVIDHARHFVMIDRPKVFEAALESAIAR
ncbi:MAG: alpha/beta hydrolase [Candidatus Eremiobacteraeota bacterium]|nr:alpha/beta hydrolase [Candidatus Eremiobacteraeota bacterium]MBC5802367.1 alpha/beta hydrolase [Candidatus Eremiobacteraeota bacterium]MBC5820585.1 alpha/beta hydrolase [Candidatus Eremiobacteraeota bacterium]